MLLRIRLMLIVRAIIAINWLLSKLTAHLYTQSLLSISDAPKPRNKKSLTIFENHCSLDICLDFEQNSREHLRTWQYR